MEPRLVCDVPNAAVPLRFSVPVVKSVGLCSLKGQADVSRTRRSDITELRGKIVRHPSRNYYCLRPTYRVGYLQSNTFNAVSYSHVSFLLPAPPCAKPLSNGPMKQNARLLQRDRATRCFSSNLINGCIQV